VVHISDGKDSQTVKDFVETLEQQNGKKEQVKAISCDMSPCNGPINLDTFQATFFNSAIF
jgi:hypothetical protein